MSTSISGTSIVMDTESDGLALTGTFAGGTLPTTASLFMPGCVLTNSSNGDIWTNVGTTAVPVWESNYRTKVVTLTAANIIAMYTTPIEIVPAVAGKALIVDSVDLVMTRTATSFTGGGTSVLQYNSTANGAGTATTATVAAAVITGAAGVTYTSRIPVVLSDVATASITGIGLYYSNITGVFASGTGTAVLTVKYHLV